MGGGGLTLTNNFDPAQNFQRPFFGTTLFFGQNNLSFRVVNNFTQFYLQIHALWPVSIILLVGNTR